MGWTTGGRIGRCKVGDYVIEMGPDSAAAQWLFLLDGCAVGVGLGVVAKDAAAHARAAALTLFDGASSGLESRYT